MIWPAVAIGVMVSMAATIAPRALAASIPVEAFAASDLISDAALSPDGRHVAVVMSAKGRRVVIVRELRAAPAPPQLVLADVPGQFEIDWCRWATSARLLCGFVGVDKPDLVGGTMRFVITRLVAVDADGGHKLVLLQNSDEAGGQFQDRVIDWHPGKADTVLIEADESLLNYADRAIMASGGAVLGATSTSGYPAVFELNVVTGKLHLLLHSHPPIRQFLTDFHGLPRVGYGVLTGTKTIQYFVRRADDDTWRRLLKYEAFDKGDLRTPIAIDAVTPTRAYAIGDSGGRDALWSIDLTDAQPPQLVYANDSVDVSGAIFLKNGQLVGVPYETDRPHVYYVNAQLRPVMLRLDMALSDTTNTIVDCATDQSLCVVRSTSDVQPGLWFLLDTASGKLTALGRTNPSLAPDELAPMHPVAYPARDGTMIPGYLTKPPDAPEGQLPLIVMPHGGPIARDRWQYFFLQQFLASRGYAVLQMNFRGSGGFGNDWYAAAHQDWGGLTYDDIVDGARWAIQSGIADPHRVAIVGWSFGGYAALLGAVRDSDLFRCAVSIAGISDLGLLLYPGGGIVTGEILREQIGTHSAKLKADSPRRHADAVRIPILMFHGDADPQVDIEQSRAMAASLKAAGKPYQFIEFKGATHQIASSADRATMMHTIEDFLTANMGVPAASAAH